MRGYAFVRWREWGGYGGGKVGWEWRIQIKRTGTQLQTAFWRSFSTPEAAARSCRRAAKKFGIELTDGVSIWENSKPAIPPEPPTRTVFRRPIPN